VTGSPHFSIIVPTLNEARYLPLLLDDLTHQTYSDFEVIVVDANSEDETLTVAQPFTKKLQLNLHTSSERNVATQRNLGITLAQGKWFIFMDADNRIQPPFLEPLIQELEFQTEIAVFTCWLDSTSYSLADQSLIQFSNLLLEMYSWFKPIAPGAMIGIKANCCEQIRFDETLTLSEDHDFIHQAVDHGFEFQVLHQPQYTYSLRRFKKEGTLKILRTYAKLNINYLMGKKEYQQLSDYPMLGGEYYQLHYPFTKHLEDIFPLKKQYLSKAQNLFRNFLEKTL
jgi:glycosyltransferase involved in cell wall biosynthesis